MYYAFLLVGIFFIGMAVYLCMLMYFEKKVTLNNVAMTVLGLLIGGTALMTTLPSLKYILLKEYDVVKGDCVIEISSGKTADATFRMPDTDDVFSFTDIPELDAYGKAIPYYCEVTVSKDHMFEIGYKIFDMESRELLATVE
ncbi:hypothetical protein [Planomicrobium sp. CPCC 101110]|uniref:hypothetical protein n=1 Tax=Planomicrobium sp. CPCC 101110 TaxID=2599619 RepID=UPI0011B90589|nr:hypothetical protein [Planomicrobium sp. CPCC 101110]TWT27248.1 hypothetical protein FQV30_01640 [Planomicrobium sp. CPCC 101110]